MQPYEGVLDLHLEVQRFLEQPFNSYFVAAKMLQSCLMRNTSILRNYSHQFRQTSVKMFPERVRKILKQETQKFREFTQTHKRVKKSSLPEFSTLKVRPSQLPEQKGRSPQLHLPKERSPQISTLKFQESVVKRKKNCSQIANRMHQEKSLTGIQTKFIDNENLSDLHSVGKGIMNAHSECKLKELKIVRLGEKELFLNQKLEFYLAKREKYLFTRLGNWVLRTNHPLKQKQSAKNALFEQFKAGAQSSQEKLNGRPISIFRNPSHSPKHVYFM